MRFALSSIAAALGARAAPQWGLPAAGASCAATSAARAFETTSSRPPAEPPHLDPGRAAAARASAARGLPAQAPQTVGFVGVGNMGGPMAAALIRAGHKLLVVDRNPAALARLEFLGAVAAGSPREVAETPGAYLAPTPAPPRPKTNRNRPQTTKTKLDRNQHNSNHPTAPCQASA
jgi:hypothetical protein